MNTSVSLTIRVIGAPTRFELATSKDIRLVLQRPKKAAQTEMINDFDAPAQSEPNPDVDGRLELTFQTHLSFEGGKWRGEHVQQRPPRPFFYLRWQTIEPHPVQIRRIKLYLDQLDFSMPESEVTIIGFDKLGCPACSTAVFAE